MKIIINIQSHIKKMICDLLFNHGFIYLIDSTDTKKKSHIIIYESNTSLFFGA